MEQSPCLKAYSSSAGQELPQILRNAKVLPRSENPPTCPYPAPDQSSPSHSNRFLKSI